MKKVLAVVFGSLLLSAPQLVNAAPSVTDGYRVVEHGRQTVATGGTPVQLSSTSTPCKMVIITGETDNTGLVVFGGSNTVDATLASRTGTPVFAGQSYVIYVKNLNQVWLDVETNGEGVTYTYYK
jgi:hypothetical protein